MQIPELLSPAGNPEKLSAAVRFGADAVYLAGKSFGMRSACDNFTLEEMADAISLCHKNGVKVYITLNTMPRPDEYADLYRYISSVNELKPDAYIVADLGVMSELQRINPSAAIHVSTQASIVSAQAALAYAKLGASRAVLAREMSLSEIEKIKKEVGDGIELEIFIHGAMCVSYSGRCLLSNHFTGRDGNRGQCAQPCRWNYKIFDLEEQKRPGQYVPVMQTDEGTFIMSSRDMCMIEHIPQLVELGVSSFKIEGRMKSAYYTAVVTNTYKMAINSYISNPAEYKYNSLWLDELCSVSHREYDTGYFFDKPMTDAKTVTSQGYINEKPYYAYCVSYDNENGRAVFFQKNHFKNDTEAELLTPGNVGKPFYITDMTNEEGEKITCAPHPKMLVSVKAPYSVKPGDILRGKT